MCVCVLWVYVCVLKHKSIFNFFFLTTMCGSFCFLFQKEHEAAAKALRSYVSETNNFALACEQALQDRLLVLDDGRG